MTQTFNCPSCGAPLDYDGGPDLTIRCTFCHNVVIVPESLRTGETKPSVSPTETESGPRTLGRIPQWAELVALVNDGKKIEAIKLFRELTGAGLKESKDAVEKIEQGCSFEVENYAVIPKQTNLSASQLSRASKIKQIGELLKAGNKLEAIKLYRESFDVGLAEAKDAVEKLDSTKDTPGAFDIHPPTISTRRAVSQPAKPAKTSPFTILGIMLGVAALSFICYTLALMDEYDTFDISIVFRGTSTYTPEPTEPPPPTEAPSPTPAPTETPTPDFAQIDIIASCIGNSRRCFEEGRFVGVDGAGNIYAGESTGRIQVFDSEGEYETEWHTSGDDEEIDSMAVDRQGIVYAVQGGAIYRYGGLPGEATGDPLGPVEYEGGLGFQSVVVTTDGGLVAAWNKDWQGGLFTNFSESQDDIVIFDAEGRVVRVISQALSVAAGADPELDMVVGVDSEGNIYASGLLNPGIFKFTAEGKLLDKFGLEELDGSTVTAIAVDEQGRVYVTGGPEMYIYKANGQLITSVDFGSIGLAFTDEGDLLAMSQYQLFKFGELSE